MEDQPDSTKLSCGDLHQDFDHLGVEVVSCRLPTPTAGKALLLHALSDQQQQLLLMLLEVSRSPLLMPKDKTAAEG